MEINWQEEKSKMEKQHGEVIDYTKVETGF